MKQGKILYTYLHYYVLDIPLSIVPTNGELTSSRENVKSEGRGKVWGPS